MENQWLVNVEDLPKGVVEFSELLCGCGQPYLCWNMLLEYLSRKDSENFYLKLNSARSLFFAYIVENKLGFTEHGTSIYGAWITDKGKEVLQWLVENINKIDDMVICY